MTVFRNTTMDDMIAMQLEIYDAFIEAGTTTRTLVEVMVQKPYGDEVVTRMGLKRLGFGVV